MQQCPACNYELTMAEQIEGEGKCPACGIYFAKHKARMDRAAAERVELERKAEEAKIKARANTKVMTVSQRFGGRLYCTQCGTVSNGVRHVPGSILIELVLWICFLIPGLIYSVWRHAAQKKACPSCKQAGLIPVISPKAKRELGI